jgi:hypothetical protein
MQTDTIYRVKRSSYCCFRCSGQHGAAFKILRCIGNCTQRQWYQTWACWGCLFWKHKRSNSLSRAPCGTLSNFGRVFYLDFPHWNIIVWEVLWDVIAGYWPTLSVVPSWIRVLFQTSVFDDILRSNQMPQRLKNAAFGRYRHECQTVASPRSLIYFISVAPYHRLVNLKRKMENWLKSSGEYVQVWKGTCCLLCQQIACSRPVCSHNTDTDVVLTHFRIFKQFQ